MYITKLTRSKFEIDWFSLQCQLWLCRIVNLHKQTTSSVESFPTLDQPVPWLLIISHRRRRSSLFRKFSSLWNLGGTMIVICIICPCMRMVALFRFSSWKGIWKPWNSRKPHAGVRYLNFHKKLEQPERDIEPIHLRWMVTSTGHKILTNEMVSQSTLISQLHLISCQLSLTTFSIPSGWDRWISYAFKHTDTQPPVLKP